MQLQLDQFDQFDLLRDVPRSAISQQVISVAKQFDEVRDLEEMILRALVDPNRTPHGPTEIADILTHQLTHQGTRGLAAFILKGRAYKTVRQRDISHQVFRLRKLADLRFALLGFVGNIQDAARDEFIHTATDLGVPYAVVDVVDFARLAIAVGLLCPRDAARLIDGKCRCGYRAGSAGLNILQQEVLVALAESHALGQPRGLVVMPTGTGKTRVAAIDSFRSDARRVLYIAHTHEILDVAEMEFTHLFGIDAVVRNFSTNPEGRFVDLATIQSASANLSIVRQRAHDYIVVDEFHHAAAASYRRLLDVLDPRYVLGLTATPYRTDRQDVAELCYGNIVASFELRMGIESGILVPYRYHGCFDSVDYSLLQKQRGGYTVRDLNRTLVVPERDRAIINKWRALADGQLSLAFCVSHEHASRVAASFDAYGIPSAVYLSTTPIEERRRLVERLQFGELRVLCTVDVLNEGVDVPFVDCLLFLRPTESKRIFFQQLGRGLRKSPGKHSLTVLDFIGNFANAFRIPAYLGLAPFEEDPPFRRAGAPRSSKEVLQLPIGCEVYFDDRVIDLFQRQVIDHQTPTRHNIAQILLYVYRRTCRRLGRLATRRDVDRLQLLHSELYVLVFGSWRQFQDIIDDSIIWGARHASASQHHESA